MVERVPPQGAPTRWEPNNHNDSFIDSWNLDSWHAPKQPKRDLKMRKCKALLAKGPICLQETKSSASEKEVLMQHIPGLQIAKSSATRTPSGYWSGGLAVLVPPGYVLQESHELVKGRAVAALIADRTSQYYVVSVYLHPDKVRQDLAALRRAIEGLNRADTRMILTGDCNRADERCTGEWSSFVEALQVFDVYPSLGTYRHPGGLSPLDRCLVPNDWVSSARWNPALCAIEPRGAQGHLILKLHVRLKACVLNNPYDPKHVTIPSNTFMPGKDGEIVTFFSYCSSETTNKAGGYGTGSRVFTLGCFVEHSYTL